MKKRLLSVILVVCMLCALLPMGLPMAQAASVTDITYPVQGGKICFDKETGTITDCDESVTKADIPAQIGGVAVTGIGCSAFEYCTSLTSVTIPEGVTEIGDSAFQGCTGLISVTIPDSVTHIGYQAFCGCLSLTSVTIPDSVTSIGSSAFMLTGCFLDDKNWHNGVFCLGHWLLHADIESVTADYTISNDIVRIAPLAFLGCDDLTSVTIPDSVTSIGNYAFENCTGLKSVTIGSGVTSIGEGAFANTAAYNTEENWVNDGLYISNWLIEVQGSVSGVYSIRKGTVGIASWAFSECYSLTSVTIPDSVTIIDDYAFYFAGLTSATIPNSVTNIGDAAFCGCTSLTSITIPDNVTSIGDMAFWCCSLTSVTIPSSVTNIGDCAFYSTGLTSVAIPNSVTSIGNQAFYGCNALTSVTIPGSVTSIGDGAFSGCYNLTTISVPEKNTAFCSVNGILFDKHQTALLCYPAGKAEMKYAVPGSVTSICNFAFGECTHLTSVTIPNSVKTIGDSAFSGCDRLTSITIPGGVTIIGDSAFLNCSSLTSMTIPDSVTRIGSNLFNGCWKLKSVTIPDSVTSIGGCAFQGCTGLKSVTIPNSVTGIGDSAFRNCTGLTSVMIPDSVTGIGDNAFYSCRSLQSVYFMGNAPMLGENAFKEWDRDTQNTSDIPGLTLYYIDGKEGWTSPTWNGYPTAKWNPADYFTDVQQGKWYYDAVNFVVENGLFKGTSETTFSPNEAMTRAMLVTVLWRLEGKPEAGTQTGFKDVPAGEYYAQPVAWAAANGIVMGTSDTTFSPNGKITREQMATILYRYAQQKGYDTSKSADLSKFPDNGKVSSYARQALAWANAEGLINGDEQANGTVLLDPAGNAIRAQVAAILMRYVQNIVE